jgi:hypothetical protein
LINLLKYSRWDTLLKVVAYCRRWRTKKRGTLTPLEIIEAERAVVYHSQRAGYRVTIFQIKKRGRVNHDNALAPLAQFMDAQGLIRLSGRTEAAPLIYEAKYP